MGSTSVVPPPGYPAYVVLRCQKCYRQYGFKENKPRNCKCGSAVATVIGGRFTDWIPPVARPTPTTKKRYFIKRRRPMAKAAAAVAAPKGKAKAAPAEEAAEPKASRYKGVTTGLRVAEYQNQTLAENFKNKLSDEELAANWREEFPEAKAFDAATVRVVRNLWNRGKHKNEDSVPAKPLPEFNEAGEAQPLRGEKKAAREEAAAAKAAPAKPVVKGKAPAPAAAPKKVFKKAS